MDNIDLPDWIIAIRDNYRNNPVRWMWAGATVLVVALIAVLVVPRYFSAQEEASAILTQGFMALSRDDYPRALQCFEKLQTSYSLSPHSRDALLFQGAALYHLQNFIKAEEAFRAYLAAQPRRELAAQACAGIAACREMMGDTAGARATYREMREKYAANFMGREAAVQAARLDLELGDTAAAEALYRELAGDSESLWRELARRHVADAGDTASSPPPRSN